jgi:hypothetical protein
VSPSFASRENFTIDHNNKAEAQSRIDLTKLYTVHIAPEIAPWRRNEDCWWFITKIEGLLSEEEAVANGIKQQDLLAEPDKYDPAKFTFVASNFRPSLYDKMDLFDAVAKAEKLSYKGGFRGVSDVVFAGQSGTNIQFKTDDGAISQYMKIASRSGLTAGQKVRVYYRVTSDPLTEWNVVAIERL